jgi:membrane associated rhomboid family serine protease
MIPLSDGIPARRFPIVNVSIIAANFLVWILYELPHLSSSVHHASFYPCSVGGSCQSAEPWEVSWFTAMFMHGSWASDDELVQVAYLRMVSAMKSSARK